MNNNYEYPNENLNSEAFLANLPVPEEKITNLKILEQKPIQIKDSPFEARKGERKNYEVGGSFNQNNQIEVNKELSEELSEDAKFKKRNEMINYISQPFYTENKKYKKLKTQPNIQP